MKMENDINILIVDDEANICESLKDILGEDGYKTASAGTIALAEKELKDKFFNIVIIDLKLPDGSGLELLKKIKQINEETIGIVFTGFASMESAVTAMNEGAFAYIQKPINMDEARILIKKALKMQKLSLDNKLLLNRLKEISVKDPLTGLYNYRYLRERLFAEFKRAKRYILPLSVIMIDMDYFKSINDIYGHQYGDALLKEIAKYLMDSSRSNDIVIRYGGEEFLIILPDTSKEGAVIFGGRLLEALNSRTFDPKGKKIKLKASMGIACYPDVGINTESELLNAADKVLREAKESGGNRLSIYKWVGKKEMEGILKSGKRENIYKLKEKLSKTEKRVNQTLLESIYAFAKTIETKDFYTSEHSENMVSIVTDIGKKFNLSDKEMEDLEHAAMLHDLGKIGVPDVILHKKGKLTKKEYETIKKHPEMGAEIIRNVHFLNGVVPIVLYHHERFDGLGYTSGLKGEEIPLGARIVAVADVYQALVSDRPYRKAYSKQEGLKIIKEGAGTQFDPAVVKAFLAIMRQKK